MGDTLLGALLGRNQSFEAFAGEPAHWLRETDQASFFQADSNTAVHSSPFALQAAVHSTGGASGVIAYDYGSASDAHRVWFPAVTTHTLRSTVWARMDSAAGSGALHWRAVGDAEALSQPIAHASSLARYVAETVVVSAAGVPLAGLVRASAAMPSALAYVDDALTVTDGVTLHPDWSLETRQRMERAEHRTRAGLLHTFVWHRHGEFRLPLRWLTTAEADVINWWWELQAELLLTLDSSDASAVHPCRVVNDRQPIGRRLRPHRDRWQGMLELAGLHDGRLSF